MPGTCMWSASNSDHSHVESRELWKELNGIVAPDLKGYKILMAETNLTIDNSQFKNKTNLEKYTEKV